MHTGIKVFALTVIVAAIFSGCGSPPPDEPAAKQEGEPEAPARDEPKRTEALGAIETDAAATIDRARKAIANFEQYYDSSAGYAVFPKVAKGGLVVGGAHGNGVVYVRRARGRDEIIGTAEVAQGSIGLQIGGQTFSEMIFFEDDATLENFKKSNMEFSGRASGVAGGEGAAEVAKYENGVAIFVFGQKGLMGEAAIGGQKFTFKPLG
jgi:lipid-binding SYLF domain-containing protein